MIPIGVGIGTVAATLAGGLVLTAVLLAPPPTPPQSVWFDQPDNYSIVAAGGAVISMHASTDRTITQFRLVVTRNHEVVTVLNDTTPDSVFFGDQAAPLVSGSTQWKADPGEYRLTVSYLTSAGWVSGTPVRVTVPDGQLVAPNGPDSPAPQPTEEPTVEPTTDPTIPEPEQTSAPTVPNPPVPVPSAPPTTAPTSPPSTPPTGTVRRSVTGTTTKFVAEGVQPPSAYVDVQVQITSGYNTASQPSGSWTSVGCGNLTAQSGTSPTKYTCTTAAWTPGSQSSSYRTAHVRVVVTAGGQSAISYGADWLIDPQIN